jgi:hypothetical protein
LSCPHESHCPCQGKYSLPSVPPLPIDYITREFQIFKD